MVSVLLAGTPETSNILSDETPDQYQHVTALCPISTPSLNLLRTLKQVKASLDTQVDVLDAVIVAIQMIILHCRHLKYEKRITIFTDTKQSIDWLDSDYVVEKMNESDIRLTLIGSDYALYSTFDCPETIKSNYDQWHSLVDKLTESEIISLQEAYEMTQEDYAKEVRPTPTYRGFLRLGNAHHSDSSLSLSINMYLRTKELKPASSSRASALSADSKGEVEKESAYTIDMPNEEDEDMESIIAKQKEISKDELEKAFKLGKTVVKIAEEELEFHKYRSNKDMSILGFIPAATFPRHYLYSNAHIITSGTNHPIESNRGLTALAYALYEKDCLALVRYVYRDDSAPRIGILMPELIIGSEDKPDTLLLQFFDVPYAEDIRDYKFNTIKDVDQNDMKGEQMMHSLVDAMNLDQLGKDYLQPEDNFNPIYWRFNKTIKTKALDPDAPIPSIKPSHMKQFKVAPELEEKVGDIGKQLTEYYKVKKVAEKTKKKKRRFDDMEETEEAAQIADIQDILESVKASHQGQNATDSVQPAIPQTSLFSQQVDQVGMITPVDDFLALVNQPSATDMVDIATKQLVEVIMKLLEISFGNQNYGKAIQCLKALREVCKKEDAAMVYNRHAQDLKAWCQLDNTSSPRRQFWEMLKSERLGLITNQECNDTDNAHMTPDVAERFWNEQEDAVASEKPVEDQPVHFDADELEDMF
ncbi:SPOC like C-terminal domain-containing protein [Blakeslea trispora]|nr:SPOC like C-terminal domain-containing protein [Blakeslea trispora]